ncbi:MAG TPA: DNA gyrase subunit A [Verrucomicrobiae bacterium]|nr:DNA gyrase subunit A [Verrucomicrobiae bacterium]
MYAQNEKVTPVNISEQMQQAYIDYSMSVIVGRALPDARDGLKPSNRRVLYAMRQIGLLHNRSYSKCAKVVGEVLGKYHPHGDASVYDTLVRMAQDFAMRYPLIDGQGNFGSIDGDPAAAYRYTECRLKEIAEELLADLDKDTVNFQPNFDEKEVEPVVLPARIPNLLVNGSTGIAVGMATNIPPHNLTEIIDACCALIDNPETDVKDVAKFVKGADFPTGGLICGKQGIKDYLLTGRGSLKIRGRIGVEEVKGGKERLIISEIPYNVNKASLIERTAQLVNEKKLDGISDIRDESNKDGIRVVIELKRDAIPKVVINNLYKHTQLEDSFGVIMLAIDHGRPRIMNIKQMIECYIAHRREVITRRTKFELQKAEERAHILEGFRIALDNIDAVVKIIRNADDREDAKKKLIDKFKLSEVQCNAILEMRLYQLTGLERDKIEEEYLAIIKSIEYLKSLLASEKKLMAVVKTELLEVKEKYGDARRTDIVADEGEINIEDLIVNEACIVTISHQGYIKRTAVSAYRSQRRGGKGVMGMEQREEDFIEHLFTCSTHDYIMFFTEEGRVYVEKVYELPEMGRAAKGKSLANFLQLRPEEKVSALIRVKEFTDKQYLFMATKVGIVKKTNLGEYANPRKGGVIGIKIEQGDRLIGVKLTSGNNEIVLVTKDGMSIRFHEDEARDMGRASVGNWGIRPEKGDYVIGVEIVDTNATLLVAGEHGIGKRTPFDEYRVQSRGGKGIITMKTTDKVGSVVGALSVTDTDEIMLSTSQGQTVRTSCKDIRIAGRNTQGVKLIDLNQGDKLVAIARVISEQQEQEAESAEADKSNKK